MIEELTIKNFAIVDDLSLEPARGLNIFTGETGTGKSIFLEAIAFLFAQIPATREMVRLGAYRLEVSARMNIKDLRKAPAVKKMEVWKQLEELGIDISSEALFIRRFFDADTNKTKAFIEDVAVSTGTLKNLGRCVITFHTQGSTSQLFSDHFAMGYLCQWIKKDKALEHYQGLWHQWIEARQEFEKHEEFIRQNRSKIDWLRFQLEELNALDLNSETLRHINEDLPLWMTKEAVVQTLSETRCLFAEGENAVTQRLSYGAGVLSKLIQRVGERSDLRAMVDQILSCQRIIEEVAYDARHLQETLDYDPQELEALLTAKAKMDRLMNKHHYSQASQLVDFREKLILELRAIENADFDNCNLRKKTEEFEAAALVAAKDLSLCRELAAKDLTNQMNKELAQVGLPEAHFKVMLKRQDKLSDLGMDEVQFLFAPNPGEGLRDLKDIASTGEASRLVLAFLSLEAQNSGSASGGAMVFDEIEQGLSAKMAATIGKKLALLACQCQLFLITHSPILASLPATHFCITKKTLGGRTVAQLHRIPTFKKRREEILRLLGAAGPKEERILIPYVESLLETESEQITAG